MTARKLLASIVTLVLLTVSVQAQESEDILRIGLRPVTNLDPALGAEDDDIMFNHLIYEYLIDITPEGELVPALATEWIVSDDGLSYTLTLREGVTFHDGSAFDAADVVYSFNRLVTAGSSIISLMGQDRVGEDAEGNATFEPIWTVEAVDDLTVQFTLSRPNADFIYGIASRFSFILPEGLEGVNELGDNNELDNFVGTGPFIITDFDPGESASFTANENYWEPELPLVDGVRLFFFDDEQTRRDAVLSGTVDFAIRVPDNLLDSLRQAEGVIVEEVATNVHPIIRLRADEGHIGEDVRMRQAFKWATDRELLNLDVLNGRGTVGNNDPIGPVYRQFYQERDNQGFDPERACELIAEVHADDAGNGFIAEVDGQARVQAEFNVIDAFIYGLLAEFVQQQWAEGCIDVDLFVLPGSVYYGGGDRDWLSVDLGLTNWGTRPVPQEYFNVAYTTGGAFNESHWSNERVDELTQEAAVTTNLAERRAIYDEIGQIFLEEGPIIIPFFTPISAAYQNAVQGIDLHPFPGRTDLRFVSSGE